jgi:hypothetical protein
MWLLVWLAVSLSVSLQQASPPPSAPAASATQAASSKIWIGRYAEFEEFIRSAKIDSLKDIGTGVTRPRHAFFAPGGLASGVIVKNLPPGRMNGYWESYKSEIAAYQLDRLLEMDMVPPTVEREVEGVKMSAQLWAENTRMLKENNGRPSPDAGTWNFQVHRQRVFDDLMGNIDENAGNILLDPAWNLILIDHSRCFTSGATMPFPLTEKSAWPSGAQIDRPFFERLKALDDATVKRTVGDLMPPGGLVALLKRRDDIVKTFNKLAADKGEAQVFQP